MAGSSTSMLCSFLLFTTICSVQVIYKAKLSSSELFTILGGFSSSLLFLSLLTSRFGLYIFAFVFLFWEIFIGNFQESTGVRTGWGAVILAEFIALIAASTVHRVCITTCLLFSAGLLYEVNKLSVMTQSKTEARARRH